MGDSKLLLPIFYTIGTVYKHSPAVSSRLFSKSRTPSTLARKKPSFLALEHFYPARFSETFNKVEL